MNLRNHHGRALLLVVLVGILGMWAPQTLASAGASGPSASGHANLDVGGGQQTFSFHIRENASGDDGSFQLKSRGQEVKLHGHLDCLRVIDRAASVSGIITKSDNPSFPAGSYVLFTVVDNGEGASAPPDRWSDVYVFSEEVSCDVNYVPPNNPVLEGNFQVKP